MKSHVPALSPQDWVELSRLVLQPEVEDWEGRLLICIGTLNSKTVAPYSKVFAHVTQPEGSKYAHLFLPGSLVYLDEFTKELEPFKICRILSSGAYGNVGIMSILDPIIPFRYLADDIEDAGPNVRALAYEMIEHYKRSPNDLFPVAETLRKIFHPKTDTCSRKLILTLKRPSPNQDLDTSSQKRQITDSEEQESTEREVIVIEDSDEEGMPNRKEDVLPHDATQDHSLPVNGTPSSFRPLGSPFNDQGAPIAAIDNDHGTDTQCPNTLLDFNHGIRNMTPINTKLPPWQANPSQMLTPPTSPDNINTSKQKEAMMCGFLKKHTAKLQFVQYTWDMFDSAGRAVSDNSKELSMEAQKKVADLIAKVQDDIATALSDL